MSGKGIDTHEQYRLNHRINDNGIVERRCSKCLEWKEEDINNYYIKNKKKPELGFAPECKKCAIERSAIIQNNNKERSDQYKRNWRKKNKEKAKKQSADWHQTHKARRQEDHRRFVRLNPDKIKEYGQNHRDHDITKNEWECCLIIFDHRCVYCGMTEKESLDIYKQKLHKDHYKYDGANDISNAVPACKICNSFKHRDDGEVWFREQEFFDEDSLDLIKWWVAEGYKEYVEDKPPYRIIRKQNEDKRTYHWELWTVDEQRNVVKCIHIADKKKNIDLTLIPN